MQLTIVRTTDTVQVLILPHKETGKYSYINLTKGHICPCMFDSVEEALADLATYDNIVSWSINNQSKDLNHVTNC